MKNVGAFGLGLGIVFGFIAMGWHLAYPGDGLYHVTRVVDADTIEVAELNVSVRLDGYDSPESTPGNWRCEQELADGLAATRALTFIIVAADWTVDLHNLRFDTDRYGRASAYGYAGDVDIAAAMIAADFARPNHGERRGSWCE